MTLTYRFNVCHYADGKVELDMTLDEWENLTQEERDEIIDNNYEKGYEDAWFETENDYQVDDLVETFAEEG